MDRPGSRPGGQRLTFPELASLRFQVPRGTPIERRDAFTGGPRGKIPAREWVYSACRGSPDMGIVTDVSQTVQGARRAAVAWMHCCSPGFVLRNPGYKRL